jgi:hypothetical protein
VDQSEIWLHITCGLAKCGLDGKTISNKSLINFSPGLTLSNEQKFYLELLNNFQHQFRREGMLLPALRQAVNRYVQCDFSRV